MADRKIERRVVRKRGFLNRLLRRSQVEMRYEGDTLWQVRPEDN